MAPSFARGAILSTFSWSENRQAGHNGLCFHVSQAFFPRTGAWENLKKALKADYEEGVWDHLAGTTSAPFPAATKAKGDVQQVAVKVVDDRGNELLVVKELR